MKLLLNGGKARIIMYTIGTLLSVLSVCACMLTTMSYGLELIIVVVMLIAALMTYVGVCSLVAEIKEFIDDTGRY